MRFSNVTSRNSYCVIFRSVFVSWIKPVLPYTVIYRLHDDEHMMNIEEEKEIVEKMKKKGNSEVEYAEGMLSVLAKVAEGMSPDQIKAYVNNTLRCLEND